MPARRALSFPPPLRPAGGSRRRRLRLFLAEPARATGRGCRERSAGGPPGPGAGPGRLLQRREARRGRGCRAPRGPGPGLVKSVCGDVRAAADRAMRDGARPGTPPRWTGVGVCRSWGEEGSGLRILEPGKLTGRRRQCLVLAGICPGPWPAGGNRVAGARLGPAETGSTRM